MSSVLTRRSILTLAGGALAAPTLAGAMESDCIAYLDAWSRKDIDGISARLHPQVHFKGPMQELNGREAVLEATRRIFPLLERFEVRGRFISGNRAMFAYDFICREPIGICRTAELVRFEGGLIRDTEVFFDARPFEALQRAQAAAAARSGSAATRTPASGVPK